MDEGVEMTKYEKYQEYKKKVDKALQDTAYEMYLALQEACHEMCHQNGTADDLKCDFWDADKKICMNEDGKCFVQKWLKVLKKARGEK